MANESELVALAQRGDRKALNELVTAMKQMVYTLALKMLGSPSDAEDSTQEILIRLVTGLRDFRAESSFRTWVYRVAANHLLTSRKKKAEEKVDSFETMEALLEPGLVADLPPLEDKVLVREAKLRCTSGMLLSLDRDHRLAFIFGEILELPSEEGAAVLEIAPEAFRKRLSRSRTRMAEFLQSTCGIVDPTRKCRCEKQAACGAKSGYLDHSALTWAHHPVLAAQREAQIRELDDLTRATELFRGLPTFASSPALVEGLRQLLDRTTSGLI